VSTDRGGASGTSVGNVIEAAVAGGPGHGVGEERLDLAQDRGREALLGTGHGQDVAPGAEMVQSDAELLERRSGVREHVVIEDDERVLAGLAGVAKSPHEADLGAPVGRQILD
jgi:hypothetical protein